MDFACLNFLSSDWHDYRRTGHSEDRLQKPEWVEKFLRQWGLQVAQTLDSEELAALRELRALLQHMVEGLVQGNQPTDDDIAALNTFMNAAPLTRSLTRTKGCFRVEIAPIERNWRWVRAELAASFADLLANYDPSRIKICANPDCRWVFYDESRSRSRRWCDDGTCGNIMKVRRFRARQRSGV